MTAPRLAICMAPGGLPGIEQHVGAWLACDDLGIRPAWLSGVSAGAVIGSLWATGEPACNAEIIVRQLKTGDLVKRRAMAYVRSEWLDAWYDAEPIDRMIADIIPATFEELEIPLHVGATKMLRSSGADKADDAVPVVFDGGDLRKAVRASLSIAGIWPYAEVDGEQYTDGGYTVPYLLPRMDEFDRVIVFNPMRYKPYGERDRNVISRLLWSVEQLQDYQTNHVKEMLMPFMDKVTWIDLDMCGVSCLSFSDQHFLIDAAYKCVREKLK